MTLSRPAEALDLKGLLPEQLRQLAVEMGEPAYRGDQLFAWVHGRGETRLESMSDLPLRLRRSLAEAGARVTRLQLLERRDSGTGMAVKFIFGDGGGPSSSRSSSSTAGAALSACPPRWAAPSTAVSAPRGAWVSSAT